jgi:hypothetical protein
MVHVFARLGKEALDLNNWALGYFHSTIFWDWVLSNLICPKDSRSLIGYSLVKHSGAANEDWYQGYRTARTRMDERGLHLDELGIGIDVKFMLYQFPRNSWDINGLPCEDVPIFLEEFDECEFLFRMKIVSHVSNLGGFTQEQWDDLATLVLRLDG